MRLSRDLPGTDLAHAFRKFSYRVTRQTGSYLRLTTIGAILSDVGRHVGLTRDELVDRLFGEE